MTPLPPGVDYEIALAWANWVERQWGKLMCLFGFHNHLGDWRPGALWDWRICTRCGREMPE